MLKRIDSNENGPDECVCKTTEARYGLASTVLLRLACACVFSLIFRVYRDSSLPLAVPRKLVGTTDGKR